jgi:hypothetical protein
MDRWGEVVREEESCQRKGMTGRPGRSVGEGGKGVPIRDLSGVGRGLDLGLGRNGSPRPFLLFFIIFPFSLFFCFLFYSISSANLIHINSNQFLNSPNNPSNVLKQ